jgi:hypothetical protein
VADAALTTVPSPKSSATLTIVPSGSVDAAADAATASGAVPELGVTVSLATGGWFGAETVTLAVTEELKPPLSVTAAVTVYVPAAAYVCEAVAVVTTVPSPKLILRLTIVPSGSVDALVEADTAKGAVPVLGVTASLASGGWLGGGADDTVTAAVADELRPPLSVTVAVTVKVPAVE